MNELFDVDFEDVLEHEKLMSIDFSTDKTDKMVIGLYILFVIANCAFACFGPLPIIERSEVLAIDVRNGRSRVMFSIGGVSWMNRFVELRIKPKFSEGGAVPGDVGIVSETYRMNENEHHEYHNMSSENVVFYQNEWFSIFRESPVNYSRFAANVEFVGGDMWRIVECTGRWEMGDMSFTVFVIVYRAMMSIVLAVTLVLLVIKLKDSVWHFEQKITGLLIIVGMVADMPFSWGVAQIAFADCIKLFVVAMLDSMRYKNRRKKVKQYVFGKVLMIMVDFFVRISEFRRSEMILCVLDVMFFMWFAVLCMRVRKQVDLMERPKFATYLSLSFVTIAGQCITEVRDSSYNVIDYRFVANMSIANFFVVAMITYHWPCHPTINMY